MTKLSAAVAVVLLCGTTVSAQDEVRWWVRASDAGAHVVGGGARFVHGIADPFATGTGEFAVHFAADAAGKPDSLHLEVFEPADVEVAVARAPEATPLAAGADAANARVVGVFAPGAKGVFGVVARQSGDGDWYRFVWDRERAELRIERGMSGQVLVIASRPAPPIDDAPHALALQAEGFRLRAWLDDAQVLQLLDGAHERGATGTWSRDPDAVAWQRVAAEPAVRSRAATALVRAGDRATFVAATTQAAGAWHVLELALDRPHPLLLLDEFGNEVWLLERSAGSHVLYGGLGNDLGEKTMREIPVDGVVQSTIRWPRGRWLTGQAALVRSIAVAPDGSGVLARGPSVPLGL
ncbi:MAG: hypothetical protein U1E73_01940 [Planctomycetota bacterium]